MTPHGELAILASPQQQAMRDMAAFDKDNAPLADKEALDKQPWR